MRFRRAFVAAAILGAVLPGAAGCSDGFKSRISPMPAGYLPPPPSESEAARREDPSDVDRRLAVVEGRSITLRRIVREIGGRPEGMEEAQFERQVRHHLKELVQEELFVAEAHRAGLQIPAQKLDEVVEERGREVTERASKLEGRPVSFVEYLAEHNLTEREFREQVRRQLLQYFLLKRVLEGIGPTKPQVEMDVSPAEVRRIYREHPGAFDQKRGLKFAGFSVAIEPLLKDGRSFTEADDEAKRRANALADGFRRGEAPGALAARFSLAANAWRAVDEEYVEDVPAAAVGPEARAWLLAPERRARDAAVFQVPEGEMVVGILDVRPAQPRSWEEVREAIVRAIRVGRELRVKTGLLIDMLSRPNAVWPQSLADEMIAEARELTRKLEAEPVLGSVRFQ